jgi:hypothetical protein
MLIIDEIDKCDQSNIAMAWDRMDASELQAATLVGNPTTDGFGIASAFADSSQQWWHCTCVECGSDQRVTWWRNVVKQAAQNQWVLRADTPRIVCHDCNAPLDVDSGYWHADDPTSWRSGYQISQLLAPTVSVVQLYRLFKQAEGNATLMQLFCNSKQGVGYSGRGVKITTALLRLHMSAAPQATHYTDRNPVIAGIDPGSAFTYVIAVCEPTPRVLTMGRAGSWAGLSEIMQQYRVKTCVIDSMPEMHATRDWQKAIKKCGVTAYRLEWATQQDADPPLYDDGEGSVKVERTMLYDILQAAVEGGEWRFPRLEDWQIEELTKNVRQVEETARGQRNAWTKNKPDHCHSAMAMCQLARPKRHRSDPALWGKVLTGGRMESLGGSPRGRHIL